MMPMEAQVELEEGVGRGGSERNKAARLLDLGEILMVKVSGREDARYGIWKWMLEERHYLRSAKLYGQQIDEYECIWS